MLSLISRSSRPYLTSAWHCSSKLVNFNHIRSMSSNTRPLMLMDLQRIVYPNFFLTMKNFFARMLINGYFDSTFAIKPFTEGARQAMTVVSQLIGNGQFDDLTGFVTPEAIAEVKRNYELLTSEQKQKIPIDESEIVFSYPYLIGLIMDEKTNNRWVEITMIFHVLKNRDVYREEIFQNTENITSTWTTAMKKMRENIVVCNYKFLRDMSKNAPDDSWIISGLNHWLPMEYEERRQS